jgi:hypothetical protein
MSRFLKISVIILLLFDFSLLYFIKKEKEDKVCMMKSIQTINDSITKLTNLQDINLLNTSLAYEFLSAPIDGNIKLFDLQNNSTALLRVVKNHPILIFKYSSLNCNVCVDEQITLLKKLGDKIGTENILILTNYNSPRELILYLRINQINIKVFNLNEVALTPIDKNVPYYFILDKDLLLKMLFIPTKGDINLTKQYFEKICYRFFK